MFNQTSENFRKFFFAEFTKELIRNSGATEIFELKKLLEEKKIRAKKELEERAGNEDEKLILSVKQKIKEEEKIEKVVGDPFEALSETVSKEKVLPRKESVVPEVKSNKFFAPKKLPPLSNIARPSGPVIIPVQRLPQNLQYIRPIPTSTSLDLGKLNPFAKDPTIISIECRGEDEKIIVKGSMGERNTGVVLNKEEIDGIINTFSEASRIPTMEGVYKVAVGRFVFSAIISEVVSSKFIIKKILYGGPRTLRRF